ncbi:hypothetical protein ACEN88_32295, partial [Massilia sp. CT11-108]
FFWGASFFFFSCGWWVLAAYTFPAPGGGGLGRVGGGGAPRRGNTVYVHVLNWPGDKLALPAIPARVVRASVLGGGAAKVEQSARGIEISVPAAARDGMDTVVALQLDASAEGLAPVR